MAEPIRERIFDKIVTLLQGITVANGYRQDVKQVIRKHLWLEDISGDNLPTLMVLPAAAENSKTYEELDGGEIDGYMGVAIVCMVVATDTVPVTLALERLIADVEIALTQDFNLGLGSALVKDVRDMGIIADLFPGTADMNRGYAETLYKVWFVYTRGNP